jgi:hypothetical protein
MDKDSFDAALDDLLRQIDPRARLDNDVREVLTEVRARQKFSHKYLCAVKYLPKVC